MSKEKRQNKKKKYKTRDIEQKTDNYTVDKVNGSGTAEIMQDRISQAGKTGRRRP